MKTIEQVRTAIERRLANTWHQDVVGPVSSWPYQVALGGISRDDLLGNFSQVQTAVAELRDWAAMQGLSVPDANRRVHGTTQPIPTHVTVPDLRTAASVCGASWVTRLDRGSARAAELLQRFPCSERGSLVRAVDGYSPTDFRLLLDVAEWFTAHNGAGMTPRQVPVPGVHAKWLNTHQQEVEALVGRPLALLPRHPPRVHFTYLDSAYRAAGGRLHDSATADDEVRLPYVPEVVIVSENKDTAIHFPELERGVSVEGAGFGAATLVRYPWIVGAPHLIYWGDIDTHGYEILNGCREAGLRMTSVLMDLATFEIYERFGTSLDRHGRLIEPTVTKPLPHLTPKERLVYEVVGAAPRRARRLEQERIPLRVALAAVRSVLNEDRSPADGCVERAGAPGVQR